MMAGVCGLLIIALGMRLSKAANTGIQNIRQFLGRAFPALVVGFVGATALGGEGMSPVAFILFTASAAIIAVMRPLMVSRTPKGSNILSEAEGLKLYMTRQKKRGLKCSTLRMRLRNCLKGSFHMPLHLTGKTWGNRFEKVLTQAGYKPEWYSGPSPFLFLNGTDRMIFHQVSATASVRVWPQIRSGDILGDGRRRLRRRRRRRRRSKGLVTGVIKRSSRQEELSHFVFFSQFLIASQSPIYHRSDRLPYVGGLMTLSPSCDPRKAVFFYKGELGLY